MLKDKEQTILPKDKKALDKVLELEKRKDKLLKQLENEEIDLERTYIEDDIQTIEEQIKKIKSKETDKATGGMSEVKEDIETDDDGYIESLIESADTENYVDPEDMDASETVSINVNNIIRETKETTEETQQEDEGGFTEEEAKEAVIEFTGRGINDLFEDLDDADIDSDEDTELFSTASSNEIRLTGVRKKI